MSSELTDARSRLIYALDYPTLPAAERGAREVAPSVGWLKVGLELFVHEGPRAVALGSQLGCRVFLDLKLHDIPETVERAVAVAGQLGAGLLTIHASGGPRMLEAAAQRAQRENTGLRLLAVTVLTSLDAKDLGAVGVSDEPGTQALRLARLAVGCGVSGLVCAVTDAPALRRELGPVPWLVTPGIRPAGSGAKDDQKRVGTPAQAVAAGASLLVVGRPIRDAAQPGQAAREILDEIDQVLRASPT
ncbi:MAG TPA: orotidine-5'-phosphate decarboxylase [Polyangiaceae bacterium]|nr:orotidine-5'-phosphate decarboxylase [Polyangiaceae bacterium]